MKLFSKIFEDKKRENVLTVVLIPLKVLTFEEIGEYKDYNNIKITKFGADILKGLTFDYLDNYTLTEVLKNREVIEVK